MRYDISIPVFFLSLCFFYPMFQTGPKSFVYNQAYYVIHNVRHRPCLVTSEAAFGTKESQRNFTGFVSYGIFSAECVRDAGNNARDSVGKAEFPAISREREHPLQTNFSRGSPRQLATTLDAKENFRVGGLGVSGGARGGPAGALAPPMTL
jgi:hypothetical protein